MFSCPPRHEAHGQAARNNPNGYILVCPESHVIVNSRLLLLAVMPVGFSFFYFPYVIVGARSSRPILLGGKTPPLQNINFTEAE